ncbi:uncharacterized protein LOC133831040 [Humulus lupulus]|uniref:uncharacterized protein LOC133831040 n=1 Tax=Humulus lupulus TaxID=3486 RepID=UPI002B40D623|nr:uncharacterized protein LOC133831040 [Humulus lupulus]
MMKLSTKPISSPGRTEKFPPPLMRFLRTNVGSKSRGRSRASPMFVRKKNPSAIETQEPSSPKVTCMGQVRVRRSSKQKPSKPRRTKPAPTKVGDSVGCRCRWIPRALLCRHFAETFTPKLCRPVWSKWCSYFQVSFRRKVGSREEPSKIGSRFDVKSQDSDEEEEEKREAKIFAATTATTTCSSSPPKNAFILTRCRSAPYRSSSLASRFWGSPLNSENIEQKEEEEEEDSSNERKPISKLESFEPIEPEIEQKLKLCQEVNESTTSTEKISPESANTENEKEEEESKTEKVAGFERPLILTRCKSEPARTGEKLDPELLFWKNTRLGIVNSCSPTVCD